MAREVATAASKAMAAKVSVRMGRVEREQAMSEAGPRVARGWEGSGRVKSAMAVAEREKMAEGSTARAWAARKAGGDLAKEANSEKVEDTRKSAAAAEEASSVGVTKEEESAGQRVEVLKVVAALAVAALGEWGVRMVAAVGAPTDVFAHRHSAGRR